MGLSASVAATAQVNERGSSPRLARTCSQRGERLRRRASPPSPRSGRARVVPPCPRGSSSAPTGAPRGAGEGPDTRRGRRSRSLPRREREARPIRSATTTVPQTSEREHPDEHRPEKELRRDRKAQRECGRKTLSRYLQTTASANASGIERFDRRTPLIAGTHRSAAA